VDHSQKGWGGRPAGRGGGHGAQGAVHPTTSAYYRHYEGGGGGRGRGPGWAGPPIIGRMGWHSLRVRVRHHRAAGAQGAKQKINPGHSRFVLICADPRWVNAHHLDGQRTAGPWWFEKYDTIRFLFKGSGCSIMIIFRRAPGFKSWWSTGETCAPRVAACFGYFSRRLRFAGARINPRAGHQARRRSSWPWDWPDGDPAPTALPLGARIFRPGANRGGEGEGLHFLGQTRAMISPAWLVSGAGTWPCCWGLDFGPAPSPSRLQMSGAAR